MSSAAERSDRSRGRSIAWPIFALVIVSVLLVTALNFAITFSGPPPRDPPRSLTTLAVSLATGAQPVEPGPRLIVGEAAYPPKPLPGEHYDPAMSGLLARMMRLPSGDAVVLDGLHVDRDRPSLFGRFTVAARRGAGWRIVRNPPQPLVTRWHAVTLAAMLAAILALCIPAWAIARAITRPLRHLSVVARAARVGTALPPMPTYASHEVRELGRAITTMHARLVGHAEGRTTMLAAIAHDLGTPLSRLAFWIEQLPDAARLRAAADIDEMRVMIAGAVRFARDEAAERSDMRIDLGSVLDSLVDDMREAGAPVDHDPGPRAIVRGDAGALRRMATNLIENAVRYGERAYVRWTCADDWVEITVEDDGPGIDPATVERLFEPFVRGDPSRNRRTGGTGLGLAIVRSIAIRHGGDAMLLNGPAGARAIVRLPLSH